MQFTVDVPDNIATVEDPRAALEEVDAQLAPILETRQTLYILADSISTIDRVNKAVSDALGRSEGSQWRQPLGAHEAYPSGAVVRHKGRLWTSNRGANVWEPETSDAGWDDSGPYEGPNGPKEEVPEPAIEWVEGRIYKVGDKVTFEGKTYACVQEHMAYVGAGWNPVVYAAGWSSVT